VQRTVHFVMGNDARIFCIRVSGLQNKPLSEEVLAELKDWSTFTERFPNGDILYCSPHMLGNPGNMLLKFLHDKGVRFNYFARLDAMVPEAFTDVPTRALPKVAPPPPKVYPRPSHFSLSIAVDAMAKVDAGTQGLIHDTCIEEWTCSELVRRHVIPPFERFAVAMIMDQLIRLDVGFALYFAPEEGGT